MFWHDVLIIHPDHTLKQSNVNIFPDLLNIAPIDQFYTGEGEVNTYFTNDYCALFVYDFTRYAFKYLVECLNSTGVTQTYIEHKSWISEYFWGTLIIYAYYLSNDPKWDRIKHHRLSYATIGIKRWYSGVTDIRYLDCALLEWQKVMMKRRKKNDGKKEERQKIMVKSMDR